MWYGGIECFFENFQSNTFIETWHEYSRTKDEDWSHKEIAARNDTEESEPVISHIFHALEQCVHESQADVQSVDHANPKGLDP